MEIDFSDFKYLGSYVVDCRKDFNTRKALAWSACNQLQPVWQSTLPNKTKISCFKACVESILLYGSETWTMKKELQDRLDGCYTRLLMRVKNISWRQHKTKAEIYENLPPISSIVNQRKARLAGHCHRAKEEIVSDVLLLRLKCPNRGRRPLNSIGTIVRETNIQLEDLPTMMKDRKRWQDVVKTYSTVVA